MVVDHAVMVKLFMLRKYKYQLFVVITGIIIFVIIFSFVFIACLASSPAIWGVISLGIPSILENPVFWYWLASFIGFIIALWLTILLVRRLLERKPWEK